MMPETPLAVSKTAIAQFCERHRVRELALFGSVLRPDFRATSDVDVLLDVPPPLTFGTLAAMEDELAQLFHRPVDLVLKDTLSPYIAADVLRQRRVLYVAAH